jgi:hypothetical protein
MTYFSVYSRDSAFIEIIPTYIDADPVIGDQIEMPLVFHSFLQERNLPITLTVVEIKWKERTPRNYCRYAVLSTHK